MQTTDAYLDSLDRVHELIPAVLQGLTVQDITWRPDPEANPIGWLIWHLLRAQDDHLANLGGRETVWLADGWQQRFALPYPPTASGFDMTGVEVGQFRIDDPALLTGYAQAVMAMSRQVVGELAPADLERIVDTRWHRPLRAADRLTSVVVEVAQHIGQAAYLRGLRERATGTDSGWQGYPA